ncbi:apolipoprotein N-acyltransferase [Noviherbaspirillum massiliense]|uniref:apolipoprotein N-acyltransferase n=1 Tax=Noviherbaspirillum massiliense TaxID=1465823 RepID=UPI00030E2F3B|nr:apolipoprotein N-acyltransferase [Noviherbaspirillum massiliense]
MNIRPSAPLPLTLLLALALGALNVFAFAPFNFWPLQIATLALVCWMLLRAPSPRAAAWIGWAYGSGWLVAGVHWLYISMHRYGGMPGWMAVLAVVILGAGLASLCGLATGGTAWLRQRWSLSPAVTALLVFPSAWALSEWTRGWIFTGFPWVSSGYAHNVGPLAGFAPVIGVYGLAWISALAAGCLALLPYRKAAIGLLALILAGGIGLKSVAWTEPNGEPISVRLLQGDVPQEMKFAPEQIEATLKLYYDMISAAPADLIATPETAIPLLSSQLPPDYLGALQDFAQKSNSHLVLGLPMRDGPQQYSNSVLGLSPQAAAGAPYYRYDKHHLVPFGEFIPLGFRWFVDMMHIPLGDFHRGALLQQPFSVRGQWIMPNICYEDLFGEEIAAQLAVSRSPGVPQATILLNVSNIAWFGDSIALPQHLQISQMRALETGRPMLRATNTGVTAVINPEGEVVKQLPPFQRGTLSALVQGYKGLTPYSRYGNAPVITWALLMIVLAGLLRRTKDGKPHQHDKTR